METSGSGAAMDAKTGAPEPARELTDEERSKDAFFVQLARLTEAMIDKHGKEFAVGTLVLSARFIAEGKVLIKPKN